MRNLKLFIEYNGANFSGWQKQNGQRTVQGELENAFLTLTGEKVDVEGSGRTDKGVHALEQVASVELEHSIPTKNIKYALNNLLAEDVRIKKVEQVPLDFHARFSTKRKTYRYVVQVGGERSAIKHDLLAFYPYKIDEEKIKNVIPLLTGKHNFKGFCSSKTGVTNFEREIFELTFLKVGRLCTFEVTGDGFLYNMVRIIVGTLLHVGSGKLTENDVKKALESGQRKFAGQTMPACGLYLKKVEYK